jgi:hypothetical protein
MTPSDEKELHRLSAMLEQIDRGLESNSPLREALKKAGIALGLGLIRGLRPDIERQFGRLGTPLTNPEKARLRSIGIDPESAPVKESATSAQQKRRLIKDSNATVSFYLTGESVIRAITIPKQPGSKAPTVIRVSHSNEYGPVDSDIFVRLGNPKKPLGARDFDKVSDWKKAKLVEDLSWDDATDDWKPRGKAKGVGSHWIGTYEVELLFPKGQHQIELKIISRGEQVCSIVLSKWKLNVR